MENLPLLPGAEKIDRAPMLIEGPVVAIRPADRRRWASKFDVITVGEWNIAVPARAKITLGSEVKVKSGSSINVGGTWHSLPARVPRLGALLNSANAGIGLLAYAAFFWNAYLTARTFVLHLVAVVFEKAPMGTASLAEMPPSLGYALASMLCVFFATHVNANSPSVWKKNAASSQKIDG